MPHPLKQEKKPSHEPALQSILLGEDDLDDEELLTELFSTVDSSFTLTFMRNGKRLVDHLDALSDDLLPCLLVLDYNMPELNGEQILTELKKNPRYEHIPKIIWSTSQNDTYRKRCLDAGASDYIIKPDRVNDLVDSIRYMISFC